jgi:hypothetical protein
MGDHLSLRSWRDGGGVAKGTAGSRAWHGSVLGLCMCVPAMSWSARGAARRWRGGTVAGRLVKARARCLADGSDVHARARVLASQDRGVAVPCMGYRCSGPAARCSGEEATAVAGGTGGTTGSCKKGGTRLGRPGVLELS